MGPLLDILRINDVVVYFVYGQVFFALGVAIALHSHKHTRLALARDLRWLAAFGVAHGLNEWGHIFIPIQASYLPGAIIQLLWSIHSLLLGFSFYLLLQFGLMAAFPQNRRSLLRLLPIGAFILWLVLASHLWTMNLTDSFALLRSSGAETSARLMLGFSGGALASFGVFRQAQSLAELGSQRITLYFRWTALCIGLYAMVGGLIAPLEVLATLQFPSVSLRTETVIGFAPVLRSIAGLGIAFGVIRGLEVFELETDRLIEEAERNRIRAADRARLALDTIAATVSQRLHEDALVDIALEKVLEIIGSSTGWAMLVDPGNGVLEVSASRGLGKSITRRMACKCNAHCICRRIVDGLEAVSVCGTWNCRLWLNAEMSSAFVSVPLKAQDRVVGILNITNRNYGTEDLGLLASIGKQIGLAVENARLWDELRRKEEARTQLLGRVIVAQEDERKRVARELHDETGQTLSAVIMGLGAASDAVSKDSAKAGDIVDDTREIAIQALEGLRQIILGLRPSILDDLGLVPALRRLADDLSKRSSTEIQVVQNGLDQHLSPEVTTVLFRILQEGMNNVARHSKARRAVLHLSTDASCVRAVLEDDGVGFEPAKATMRLESGSGLGLVGMHERASLLGGEVVVDSSPGGGTRLSVRLPLAERN